MTVGGWIQGILRKTKSDWDNAGTAGRYHQGSEEMQIEALKEAYEG